MITTPGHALVLGSLDLLGRDHSPGWWIEAAGEGGDFGNPQGVEKAILSFLIDGSIESYESFDNREMSLPLTVYGTNSANLAAGEAALMAEVAKRNTLVWTPPDNSGDFAGTPCVFDVVNSFPTFAFSDMNELQLMRGYTLTIKALPFTRSSALVEVTNAAPPGTTPSVTLVNNCASLTGWAKGPTVTSGSTGSGPLLSPTVYTKTTATGANWPAQVGLILSGLSVNMTSTPYVRLRLPLSSYGGVPFTQAVLINNTGVFEAARDGEYAWYRMPSGVTTLNSVFVIRTASAPGPYMSLLIADVSRSDVPANASGARQRAFSLPVTGSTRSQGSLAVEDPSVALGDVLVYTASADVSSLQQPPLRALRTAGSTETTDASLVSGKSSDLATNHVFQIQARNLSPGGFVLLARVKHATAASYSLTWAAKSVMGSTVVESSQSGVTAPFALTAATWTVVTVAHVILPSASMGSNGLAQIELSGVSGLLLDEAWLFNLDTGRLVWVQCGTAAPTAGGAANRVFINAPSLDSPTPSIAIGTATDRTDAFNPGLAVAAFGQPMIVPPSMSVFVVTTNSVAAAVTLDYFPRWHTHVGG